MPEPSDPPEPRDEPDSDPGSDPTGERRSGADRRQMLDLTRRERGHPERRRPMYPDRRDDQ